MAPVLVLCIRKRSNPVLSTKCLTWLTKFAETPGNLDIIHEKGVGGRVVDLLSSTPFSNDQQVVEMIESGLGLMCQIAKGKKATIANMDGVIKTMDTFKGRKSVVSVSQHITLSVYLVNKYSEQYISFHQKGSQVLASMLGPDDLKSCLSALSSAAAGSKERQEALIKFSSMSYIEAYAEAVVASGGIPSLCDAIKGSMAIAVSFCSMIVTDFG